MQIDEAMSEWSKQGFHLEHFYEFLARTNALLYSGRVGEAYAHVIARWPALRRSAPAVHEPDAAHLLAACARARSAIATAENGGADRTRLLHDATVAARRIERERMDWGTPKAKLLRAGIAMVGESTSTDRAVALLREAISGFDAADMALYAAASTPLPWRAAPRRRRQELVRAADAWMTVRGSIKNPARMTAMLAPGFGRLG